MRRGLRQPAVGRCPRGDFPLGSSHVRHARRRHFPGSPRSPRRFVFSLLLAWSCAVGIGPALAAEVDFARDVRPLLNQHCTPCHGGVKKAGGVSFLFRESAMAPGKSGAVPFMPGDLRNPRRSSGC